FGDSGGRFRNRPGSGSGGNVSPVGDRRPLARRRDVDGGFAEQGHRAEAGARFGGNARAVFLFDLERYLDAIANKVDVADRSRLDARYTDGRPGLESRDIREHGLEGVALP